MTDEERKKIIEINKLSKMARDSNFRSDSVFWEDVMPPVNVNPLAPTL